MCLRAFAPVGAIFHLKRKMATFAWTGFGIKYRLDILEEFLFICFQRIKAARFEPKDRVLLMASLGGTVDFARVTQHLRWNLASSVKRRRSSCVLRAVALSSETRMFLGARVTRAEDLDEKKNDHFRVDQIRNKISIRYSRFLPGFRKYCVLCDGSPAESEPKELLLKNNCF